LCVLVCRVFLCSAPPYGKPALVASSLKHHGVTAPARSSFLSPPRFPGGRCKKLRLFLCCPRVGMSGVCVRRLVVCVTCGGGTERRSAICPCFLSRQWLSFYFVVPTTTHLLFQKTFSSTPLLHARVFEPHLFGSRSVPRRAAVPAVVPLRRARIRANKDTTANTTQKTKKATRPLPPRWAARVSHVTSPFVRQHSSPLARSIKENTTTTRHH